MINKDKIVIGEFIYYIPMKWSGSCSKVKITKVIDDNLVELEDKKGKERRT